MEHSSICMYYANQLHEESFFHKKGIHISPNSNLLNMIFWLIWIFSSQALPCPIEVALSDFHACSIGRPGIDIAHFLLTSTTREFR